MALISIEKFMPLAITNVLEGKNRFGAGENVRDWLYVEDHCSAIDLITKNRKVYGGQIMKKSQISVGVKDLENYE